MKTLIVLAFLLGVQADAKYFYCEAYDIVTVQIGGQFNDEAGETLSSDVAIIIEDVYFSVPKSQLVGYWNGKLNKSNHFLLKLASEDQKNVVLDLQTRNGKGYISLNYKGVHLKNVRVTCEN